ncbi:MAG: bi-domain-containing oxidoreductase [Chloroflexota bacterium]
MKQLLQNLHTGETYIEDVPVPKPRPGSALVRTAASLVSVGTERMLVDFAQKSLVGKARSRPDLVRQVLEKARREGLLTTVETVFNRLDRPMALGYSSSGTIVAVGEGLQGFKTGDRVACAGGGYAVHAEYAIVPQNLLASLPDDVDFESAAFVTLGAIALHGFRLAQPQLGEQVAVIGLGLLGLLTARIASIAGCPVLGFDLDPQRVALAQRTGIHACLRKQAESASQASSRGRGMDIVLICADTPSNDPVELAGEIARDRGRVIALGSVGMSIPRKLYYEKELTFLVSRSYGPGRYDPNYEEGGEDYPIGYVRWTEGRNLEAVVELLASGKMDVSPLITHRFPIEQAPEAYELIGGKTEEPFLGVLLTYPGQSEKPHETVGIGYAGRESRSVGKVQLGVLGAGNFASAVMLPALKRMDKVELFGIASASGLSAQHAARKYGFRYATSNEEQILSDPEINTVAVLTPHHLHARQVVAALQVGKHVFVEKPLALNREQLSSIEEALGSSSESLLMVGFNRRFAPLAQHLQAFITESPEPLVAHYRVNAGYLPLSHWLHDPQIGGGRIIGEGCHFVDFLTFLVGQPPISVTAQGLPDAGRYREDNVLLNFTFVDGSLGVVAYLANGDRTFAKERVEVFTGGRIAVLDDFRSLELVQDGRRRMVRSRLRQNKGHRAEWEAFSQAILSGGPPPIPYKHIFGVHQATFAAVEALRSGVRVGVEKNHTLIKP